MSRAFLQLNMYPVFMEIRAICANVLGIYAIGRTSAESGEFLLTKRSTRTGGSGAEGKKKERNPLHLKARPRRH